MSTDPFTIPDGYSVEKHEALHKTIAEPGVASLIGNRPAMACHESPPGAERICTGWLSNQLGPGNNLSLRLQAVSGTFGEIILDGEQHLTFEDTLPERAPT